MGKNGEADCNKRWAMFRNGFAVSIAFILGYRLDKACFTPFNKYMSVTLSKLIINDSSSLVLYTNLQRLLGLSLADALPAMIAAITSLIESDGRIFLYMFLVIIYFAFACHVFKTS